MPLMRGDDKAPLTDNSPFNFPAVVTMSRGKKALAMCMGKCSNWILADKESDSCGEISVANVPSAVAIISLACISCRLTICSLAIVGR